ncbi:helix-turn-helix transcriptional regulator [Sphingobium sp. LMA1-1-1.1]|uniref:helix-turn-helix domain-containing protein n=1 Tax=Sphingobium sp. LMA1-1-1.1 TaxID=3135238 RepID=UPI00343DDF80
MMPLASTGTEFEYHLERPGNGRVICVSAGSADNSVIRIDRSQARSIPGGYQLLDSFLDSLDNDEELEEATRRARVESAAVNAELGAPVTLVQLRLSKGLSQKQLSALMKTSQNAISLYERRERKPGEEVLRQMAAIFEVDFNTLMEALQNADH